MHHLFFPTEISKGTLIVDGVARTVDKAALQVGDSRIRIVDVGERSIIVQAVEDLRPVWSASNAATSFRCPTLSNSSCFGVHSVFTA
ncbi:hypothetical protein [Pyxidicoccus trucidator]|uniref:hypothetical protein n=1 Tax=Pyxidicoccus trucidator TaxID=2709662 RepID=UPI0013DA480A|nr:hypothetical protein [Pyxidicoccus trucidator]